MNAPPRIPPFAPLGIGLYTVPEAARLLKTKPGKINRWLGGYSYHAKGKRYEVRPLWSPDLPKLDDHIELSFRDLIELRFVLAFLDIGLGMKTIRTCLERAHQWTASDRPFSTSTFRTDGRTIFLESLGSSDEPRLLDLRKRQYAFKRMVERSFKDLDLENEVVTRWRPFRGKTSIVIDPKRAFGQPIAAEYGVPTVALAEAVEAEGSIERVAGLFDVSPSAIHDAVRFERELQIA